MMIYKGYKAKYLGLERWKVTAPDGFTFDIIAHEGILEMMTNIERWRKIWA